MLLNIEIIQHKDYLEVKVAGEALTLTRLDGPALKVNVYGQDILVDEPVKVKRQPVKPQADHPLTSR